MNKNKEFNLIPKYCHIHYSRLIELKVSIEEYIVLDYLKLDRDYLLCI